ncbi:unnamed protein product [Rhodiola kirilowii]
MNGDDADEIALSCTWRSRRQRTGFERREKTLLIPIYQLNQLLRQLNHFKPNMQRTENPRATKSMEKSGPLKEPGGTVQRIFNVRSLARSSISIPRSNNNRSYASIFPQTHHHSSYSPFASTKVFKASCCGC